MNSRIHGISHFRPSATSTTQLAAFRPAGLSPSQLSSPTPNRVKRNDHFPALLLKALETLLDTCLKAQGLLLIPFGLLSGLFFLYLPLEAGGPEVLSWILFSHRLHSYPGSSQMPKLYLSTTTYALDAKIYTSRLALSSELQSRQRPTGHLSTSSISWQVPQV